MSACLSADTAAVNVRMVIGEHLCTFTQSVVVCCSFMQPIIEPLHGIRVVMGTRNLAGNCCAYHCYQAVCFSEFFCYQFLYLYIFFYFLV